MSFTRQYSSNASGSNFNDSIAFLTRFNNAESGLNAFKETSGYNTWIWNTCDKIVEWTTSRATAISSSVFHSFINSIVFLTVSPFSTTGFFSRAFFAITSYVTCLLYTYGVHLPLVHILDHIFLLLFTSYILFGLHFIYYDLTFKDVFLLCARLARVVYKIEISKVFLVCEKIPYVTRKLTCVISTRKTR